LSVGDFSGVGRGYQAQDAHYWLVRTIIVGRNTQRHARMWGMNSWKGISDDESVQRESYHLSMRCRGSDGERKLRVFDEKPDLVTSIPSLDQWVPRPGLG
jgi:hypothetical protein